MNALEGKNKQLRMGRPFTMTGNNSLDCKQATDKLLARRSMAVKDRPKSSEDNETSTMLQIINSFLENEFIRLGLINLNGKSKYIPLDVSEVQGVERISYGDAGNMFYNDTLDIIKYEIGQSKISKFVGLLHEAIHTTQFTEFTPMMKNVGASTPDPVIVRGGYMTGEGYRGGSPSYWKWLNEANVHTKTLEIVRNKVEQLTQLFSGTKKSDWLSQDADMYSGSLKLFDAIISRLADESSVTSNEIRDDFFVRSVTGKMEHLDVLNSVFGPQTTTVLEKIYYRDLDTDFAATTVSILGK